MKLQQNSISGIDMESIDSMSTLFKFDEIEWVDDKNNLLIKPLPLANEKIDKPTNDTDVSNETIQEMSSRS